MTRLVLKLKKNNQKVKRSLNLAKVLIPQPHRNLRILQNTRITPLRMERLRMMRRIRN
jgi:hypothetical protein